MAGHAQLKFVMTECSKTQIRLTGLICKSTKIKTTNVCLQQSIYRVNLSPNEQCCWRLINTVVLYSVYSSIDDEKKDVKNQ